MSQRPSGYQRKEFDRYQTPAWVTNVLVAHIPNIAQRRTLYKRAGSDIETGIDFLRQSNALAADRSSPTRPMLLPGNSWACALALTKPTTGIVAMLLRTDYDHAATRQHRTSTPSKKIVLTKRIVWFDGPGAALSFNHAWYVWD